MSDPTARNVLATLKLANTDDWVNGVNWYVAAHHEAVQLSLDYDINVRAAAGVIAALSPRLSWPRNLTEAANVIRGRRSAALPANVYKAIRIRDGEDPLDVLGGPKVRAFFANIVDPLFSTEVCVDRHAADVAIGEVGDDRSRQSLLGRKGGYDAVAQCYVKVARDLGLLPHQVQAVTWEAWKRLKVYDRPQHTALYQASK